MSGARSEELIDLAQFDEAWEETQGESLGGPPEVPAGRYDVAVERVELQRSAKGHPMLTWRLRVLRPRFAGMKYWHRNLLVSRDNIRWLRRDLTRAGLDLRKLSDLPHRLEELVDVELDVRLATKGEHRNCLILRRLGGEAGNPRSGCGEADNAGFPF